MASVFPVSWHGREVQERSIDQCCGQRVGNPGRSSRFWQGAEGRLPQSGSLRGARTCPAELACVPSDRCSGGAVAVGGQAKAGWDLERLVAGWQALLSALSLICHLPGLFGRGSGDWIQMPIVCPWAGSRASRETGAGSV